MILVFASEPFEAEFEKRAIIAWYPTQLPERFLETLGQRSKALAAADRLDVLPAAVGEPEMVRLVRRREKELMLDALF